MGHSEHDFEDGSGPRRIAQICRWGIVIVSTILVPGVAFLGQGIGKWLRVQTASRWTQQIAPRGARPGLAKTATSPALASQLNAEPPSAEESAAMYDGAFTAPPPRGTLANFQEQSDSSPDGELMQASYGAPAQSGSRQSLEGFADLEKELQARGAVYYALEGDLRNDFAYRFLCVMKARAGNGAEEKFEAHGRTPLEAIQGVMRQLPGQR